MKQPVKRLAKLKSCLISNGTELKGPCDSVQGYIKISGLVS